MFDFYDLKKQYAKYPEINRKEVQQLLQWTQTQPHLPALIEQEVMAFFYACDYDAEYTKQVIDLHFTLRTAYPLYADLDIESPEMKRVENTVAIYPIEKPTPEGDIVVIGKLLDTDASKFNFFNCLKGMAAGQDLVAFENGFPRGIIFVLDLKGVSLGHLIRINPFHAKRAAHFLQDAYHLRISSIRIVNGGTMLDKVMAIFFTFLNKKISQLLHVDSSLESLYEVVPRQFLPQELGGDLPHSKDLKDIFYKHLQANRLNILEYNEKRRVIEELRPKSQNRGFFGFFRN